MRTAWVGRGRDSVGVLTVGDEDIGPMTGHARVGADTRLIAWFIVAMLPVAALTSSGVPWKWEFVLLYLVMAFLLQMLVRVRRVEVERFVHILVLSGSAPMVVRFYFGNDLGTLGLLHVVAVLVISLGVGYLLAEQVRRRIRPPRAA